MSASAIAGAPAAVIGQGFVSPNTVEIAIVKGGDKLDVMDENGNVRLEVVGHFFSNRRELVDATGNILITLKPKSFSLHSKWSVYRGESTNSEDLLFTFKCSKWTNIQYVFLGENESRGRVHDYRIEGGEKSCVIYTGESNNMVAQMNKKDDSFNTWLTGKDHYIVTVSPNVDYAFIAAIITIIDANVQKGGEDRDRDEDGDGDGGACGGGCGGG